MDGNSIQMESKRQRGRKEVRKNGIGEERKEKKKREKKNIIDQDNFLAIKMWILNTYQKKVARNNLKYIDFSPYH